MKNIKLSLILAAAVIVTFGLSGAAYAFHSGGVAECEGCHTMHNSLEGDPMGTLTAGEGTGPYLLQSNSQSGACLNCHQHLGDTGPSSYHISTAAGDMVANAPLQRSPGGDFGWLRKDYVFTVRSSLNTNHGERRGHNIVATDFGYNQDSTLTVAPGGDYPAENLHCSSCHDPHGTYRRDTAGNIATSGLAIKNSGSYNNSAAPTATNAVGVFRILGGIGYTPKSLGSNAFVNDVPVAVAPSTYNRTEAVTETRSAYGKGMSEWCANCHTAFLQNGYTSGDMGLRHPAGNASKLGTTFADNYNKYVKSGNWTGLPTNSFTSLIPFEEGVANHSLASYTQLQGHAKIDNTYLNGPDAVNANVNCLSCHRAHASGFESMLRFPHANEFMTIADAAGVSIYPTTVQNAAVGQGLSPEEQQAALYDRPATVFAPYQRLLCNKCHVKD